MWCIGTLDSEYLAKMEALLDLYQQPYNPAQPVVCFDECPVQLLGDVTPALPAAPGTPARVDYEYVRCGTACLLLSVEPLAGWRHVEVSDQRTKVDFARHMKHLVDEAYPDAEVVHVVLDNLNTHTFGALYEAYPPGEARRIARKLRFHFTPVHASWLNMAEIELSVLSRNCLAMRHPSTDALRSTITPWQLDRNAAKTTITWRFTTLDARAKFHRFYHQASES